MARSAEVQNVERVSRDGVPLVEVQVDAGDDDPATVEHWAPPGDDSPPLAGDFVQLVDARGAGAEAAVGYLDVANQGQAEPGEKRLYARNASGAVVATIWLKGDGTVVVTNLSGNSLEMAPSGDVTIKGNLLVEGEVTAKSASPSTAVKLSTHLHPTGVGPSGAPTPGT